MVVLRPPAAYPLDGQVRIVQPAEACLPSEFSVHWSAGAAANASGSIMVHGGGFGAGGAPVNFVHFGAGVPVYRSPRAGVIQNTRILVRTNTYNGATPVRLQINGVATSITTVIPAGSTANIDVPGTVTIVDGDQVSIVLDRGASSSRAGNWKISSMSSSVDLASCRTLFRQKTNGLPSRKPQPRSLAQ